MMVWVLVAWALDGDVRCEKLAEKCRTCWHSVRHSKVALEYARDEYSRLNGSPINSNPYGGRINYAPVFVSPTMQWAVPNSTLNGPPAAPYGTYPYSTYPNQ